MDRIVILGGGFGGLSVARALRFAPVDVTLVDRGNFHIFRPLLFRAAMGPKEPRDLSAPLDRLLAGQANARIVHGEAVYLDVKQRRLMLSDRALPFDILVVAAGSQAACPDAWRSTALALQTREEAAAIRERLAAAPDGDVVVIGGGMAGVELAASAARKFRGATVKSLEGGDRLLREFPPHLAERALARLVRLGVEVRCGSRMVGVHANGVTTRDASGRATVAAQTVLWAGGTRGADFAEALAQATGVKLDENGRVPVEPDLTVAGHPDVFVIGDLARLVQDGEPLPGLATVAVQQGSYVASAIRDRLSGYDPAPFVNVDRGRFLRIGGSVTGLIADAELTGPVAWMRAKMEWQRIAPDAPLRMMAYSAMAGSAA